MHCVPRLIRCDGCLEVWSSDPAIAKRDHVRSVKLAPLPRSASLTVLGARAASWAAVACVVRPRASRRDRPRARATWSASSSALT